jgi:hypothetical protein
LDEIPAANASSDSVDRPSFRRSVLDGVFAQDEEAFPHQESVDWISDLASALDHPGTVGLGQDVGDLDASCRHVDQEQNGTAGEPGAGPDFDGEEVRGREDAPVMRDQFIR